MKNKDLLRDLVNKKKLLLLDFDGVIKDSNNAKLEAFTELFENCGQETKEKIRRHHLRNLGVSRFEKIPIYMDFAGLSINTKEERRLHKKFAKEVVEKVKDSEWIEGSYKFIQKKSCTHLQFIISATPKDELNELVDQLKLKEFIDGTYGSPTKKENAISKVLKSTKTKKEDALFIGDGLTDYEAAKKLDIEFILVRNKENLNMQRKVPLDRQIQDFTEL